MAGNGKYDTDEIKSRVGIVDLVSRTVDLKKQGRLHIGLCPFHDDKNPSLQIDEAKGYFICRSCNSQGDVIKWVQLRDKCEFREACATLTEGNAVRPSEKKKLPLGPVEATYDYTDANGKLMYQVLRHEGKEFRQRRPDPNKPGEWIYTLDGVQRYPFSLPLILGSKDLDPVPPVYITEGEKDALRLQDEGLIATSAAQGAGNWKDETYGYSAWFKGRDVIVWQDKDEPGRKHGAQVVASLKGKARSIVLVEAKVGKDAFDHFQNGGTVDDVVEIARSTRLLSMAEVQAKEVDWLIYPYFAKGTLTTIAGDPGEGKTFLTLALMSLLSQGKTLADVIPGLQRDPKRPKGIPPCNCLFLTQEDSLEYSLKPRLLSLGADHSRIYALEGSIIFDQTGLDEIEAYIREYKIEFLVIDPIMAYLSQHVDTQKQNTTRAAMNPLRQLAQRYHLSIVGIMHLNKSQAANALYKLIGSIDFVAISRTVMLLGHDPDNRDRKAMVQIKSNIGPFGKSIGYSLEEGEFSWTGISDLTDTRILEAPSSSDARAKTVAAVDWLRDQLSSGPKEVTSLFEWSQLAGFKKHKFYEAASLLKVSKSREPSKGGKGAPRAWWALEGFNWHDHWYSQPKGDDEYDAFADTE